MTTKEQFTIDYLVTALVDLPVVVDTGCNPADINRFMNQYGFPCLTDAGHRFVLWNGPTHRECHPWSPCRYPRDLEKWVIADVHKRRHNIVRSSPIDQRPITIISNPATAKLIARCEGDTPCESACLTYIEAFKNTLPQDKLNQVLAAADGSMPVAMEQQAWQAYLNGDSMPLEERIAQLQLEVSQKASRAAKWLQAGELIENGPVVAISVLDEGGFHISTKQNNKITLSGVESGLQVEIPNSITVSATYRNSSLVEAIISAGTTVK
jgi:hypothetical protein